MEKVSTESGCVSGGGGGDFRPGRRFKMQISRRQTINWLAPTTREPLEIELIELEPIHQ